VIELSQQAERRFVNDYIRANLWGKEYFTRVWLGPLPPGKEANEYMVVGRWADIVVFEPSISTIIEAKLEPSPKAIGQLQLYGNMFKQSPRFRMHISDQVNLVLVTSRVDTHVQELCEQQGIMYEVFRPEWIVFWEKQRFRT
jgi:hypothetical protein